MSTLQAQAQWEIIALGSQGGAVTIPTDIDDLGRVVGQSESHRPVNGSAARRAFLWQARPSLGLPAGINDIGTLGGLNSQAFSLAVSGEIVGRSDSDTPLIGAPFTRAFSWRHGLMHDLGPPLIGSVDPQGHTAATTLNANGQIAGAVFTGAFLECAATLWLPAPAFGLGAGVHHLPLPTGHNSGIAHAINRHAQVVGQAKPTCDVSDAGTAFLWLPTAAYGLAAGSHDLTPGLAATASARASAINVSGRVVGWIDRSFSAGTIDAFAWHQGNRAVLTKQPGDAAARALDINDAGTIVGTSSSRAINLFGFFDQYPDDGRALLWQGTTVIDLNNRIGPNSGWQLNAATAINNRGEIVGLGSLNGAPAAFLLRPAGLIAAPIPSSGAIAGWVMIALIAYFGVHAVGRRQDRPACDSWMNHSKGI